MLNVYDLKQWSWGLLSSLTCYAVTIFIAFSRGFTVSTLQLAKFNWQGHNSRAYIWRGDCLVQVKVTKRLEAADKILLSCFWNGSLYDLFLNYSVNWFLMYSFRRRSPKGQDDRAIHVKHFKNIPMADMELVLVSTGSCLFTFIFISLTGFKLKKKNVLIAAWEEKPKPHTNGLGSIYCLCCHWTCKWPGIDSIWFICELRYFHLLI